MNIYRAAVFFLGVVILFPCAALPDEDSSKTSPGFDQAKQLYDEGKLEKARAAFEELVASDPSDLDSRRYIRSIISLQRKMTHRDQGIMDRDRILDVRRSWIPIEKKPPAQYSGGRAPAESSPQAAMQERVKQIIPEINFTDAQVRDVLRYLSSISGINVVFDEGGGPEVKNALGSHITIALKEVPLLEALKYILSAKGMKHRLDDYAIVISTPARLNGVQMETRYYFLSSGSAGFVSQKSEAGKRFGGRREEDDASLDSGEDAVSAALPSEILTIQDVLEQSGVPSPRGSKIFLDRRTGILLVRNTPGNLAVIEKILGALDIAPFQVAIEAKFVDVVESAARELGMQAFFTGDFALTRRGATNDLVIHSDANNSTFGQFTGAGQGLGGLTKGIRFLRESGSTTNPAGNIFSFAQVLTQPQFQVVLHALEQSGMANVLSAPKVTTVNNQEAKIEVVTEIIYPSEYQVTPATANAAGTVITPGVAIPGGFVTRDAGVILTVTPSVGAQTKMISLALRPEVSALSGWNNFGVSAGPGNLGTNAIPILQPIFSSQNISTNVIVRDGETVVLGGLIREVTDTTDDKIPILGDIPFLGRVFRNESESSSRRNLLIFVTAYLITPQGETLREPRANKTKIFNP